KQLRPIVRRAASSPSEFRHQHCISAPPVRGYLCPGSVSRNRKNVTAAKKLLAPPIRAMRGSPCLD
ncbi:hypothetical protein, partial [Limimaricola variabilis]|uniref:hypothetical protein n=1 Tax=Limimaricola variabilis TaxID=1492771 RepID=UPI001C85B067